MNPLNWRGSGFAPAVANLGSETLPDAYNDSSSNRAVVLPPPALGLTGAQCNQGLLDVDIPIFASGYRSLLRVLYGSFHVLDYGLFYENIRSNAIARTQRFTR